MSKRCKSTPSVFCRITSLFLDKITLNHVQSVFLTKNTLDWSKKNPVIHLSFDATSYDALGLASGKKIVGIGINFVSKDKEIKDWQVEDLGLKKPNFQL